MFDVVDMKLVPIAKNWENIGVEDMVMPTKSIREVNKEQWQKSNLEVPDIYGDDIPVLKEMLNKGFFEMRCQ